MVFLLGKSLPPQQHVLYALAAQFEGVGRNTANQMCAKAAIHKFCRVRDMNERHLSRLREVLTPHLDAIKAGKIGKAKSDRLRPAGVPVPPITISKK